ncbi:MAG TPA: hypothetical protein PK375_00860 [Rhodocyclaceae bacterium]|nr:hypothetical protein [Rhodocyclaceae bacterium]
MYIVAIAWIYVTGLMALAETSITAGLLTFIFYGLAPLALLLWLLGTPERRRRRSATEAIGQPVGTDDRGDPQKDQDDLLDRRP